MKRQVKIISALLMALVLFLTLAGCGSNSPSAPGTSAPASTGGSSAATSSSPASTAKTYAESDVITYTVLSDWNGSAANYPVGWEKGPIADAFAAKTGCRFKVVCATSEEAAFLATTFASGNVPDIINAPFFGGGLVGAYGSKMVTAISSGQLLNIAPYLANCPTLSAIMNGPQISPSFAAANFKLSSYNGAQYLLPSSVAATNDDITDYAFGLYARDDILKSLNIEPSSIKTSSDLMDLMTKIKNGNFKDVNGKAVIPAGAGGNAWNYLSYINNNCICGPSTSFDADINAGLVLQNGQIVSNMLTDGYVKSAEMMWKMINQGLFDKEAFGQSGDIANTKYQNGSYGIIGGHWPSVNAPIETTLLKDHPEMKYDRIGPMVDPNGNPVTQYSNPQWAGFGGVLLFSANIKDPQRVLNAADFANTKEGIMLLNYGIDGTNPIQVNGTTMYALDSNGVPKMTEEWKQQIAANKALASMTGGQGGANLEMINMSYSQKWASSDPGQYFDPSWAAARAVDPITSHFITMPTANDIAGTWSGYADYSTAVAAIGVEALRQSAYTASSIAECDSIVASIQSKLKAAGQDDLDKWLTDQYNANPNSFLVSGAPLPAGQGGK